MKRWMVGLIVLLVIAIVAGAGILGRQSVVGSTATEDIATPATVEVTRGEVRTTVTAPGHLIYESEVDLAFRASGTLTAVNLRPGQAVEAGAVLALLDPAPFEDIVATAEIELELAKARLESMQAGPAQDHLAAAQRQLASADIQLELLEAHPSAAELAAARAEVAAAEAELQRLQALPDPLGVSQAQTALDKASALLKQAQAAYDAVRQRPDVAMLPQALALQQATIDHAAAQAGLEAARRKPSSASLQAAAARLAAAESRLAQIELGPSAGELSLAALQVDEAEAELAHLLAGPDPVQMGQAESAVRVTELALARAESDLQAATLTAPFGGVVLEVNAAPGEMVAAGQGVIRLADSGALEVEGRVIEEDLPLLHVGQQAMLFFDAEPDAEIWGTVTRIVPQRLSGDRPLYPVIIAVEDLPAGLLAGMTVDASIITDSRHEVLRLPRAVVRARSDGTATVRVWNGTAAEDRPIRTGLRGDDYVEIIEGLRADDRVVAQ